MADKYLKFTSGIGGGVVAQKAFKEEFMPPNPSKPYVTRVSQNVCTRTPQSYHT